MLGDIRAERALPMQFLHEHPLILHNYTYEFPLAYNSEDNLVSEEEFRTAQVNNFYTNNIQLIE